VFPQRAYLEIHPELAATHPHFMFILYALATKKTARMNLRSMKTKKLTRWLRISDNGSTSDPLSENLNRVAILECHSKAPEGQAHSTTSRTHWHVGERGSVLECACPSGAFLSVIESFFARTFPSFHSRYAGLRTLCPSPILRTPRLWASSSRSRFTS
jgi:hypothetical protein